MITAVTIAVIFLLLTFAAWRRYLSVATSKPLEETDTCPYSLTEIFGETDHVNVPHQKGVRWLTDVFSRSVNKYPHLTALQVPYTNESLTYAELDQRAETIAAALETHVNGPDQVVAVAMSQDNADIVASHLGILKAGGTLMFLDTTLPDELITHMLNDAQPVAILTRGEKKFRDIPTVDVLALPGELPRRKLPTWLDDPKERLAAIFYTSGTTGTPRGVECPHAGYVNLALSYADYFDLIPGMDATSLTSSLGYDGSISEMYCAWVSGCSVVLLTKEQVRSGPDLIPILCEAEVTTLFCPPVLLTTLTQNPETDLPYPICRYIVPAGEAFPSALVEPWTRNRRQIINTYGPTEASTDTSRQSLRPGEPITIGSPLPNVTYVILEIDELAPLKHGEIGELCIGGVHVARGYRNLPEQTAKKFIIHPQFGRLYRTGDKCRIDPKTFRVDFLGRIDAQLKVRGHRVEAQAVEDILQNQFAEIEAAVLDYQNDALVAFVAAPSISRKAISPAPADWAARVTATLTRQLPEPSIPTSIFVVEKFSMKAVSGKIDRRCLPDLSQLSLDTLGNGKDLGLVVENPAMLDASGSAAGNADCEAVLTICRAVFGMPIGLDDGFAESGGHSIVIARLAQQLKKAGWTVSVKALLSDCNTARRIVERGRLNPPEPATNSRSLRNEDTGETRDEAAAKVLSVGYFTTLQILFSIFLYIPAIATFIFALSEVEDLGFPTAVSFWECLLGSISLYIFALATPFLLLLWAMIVKFFLGGDTYRNNTSPGIYPKWSRMHLRVWCIERIQKMVLVPLGALYRSAPIRAFVLRQLGATVGSNLQCANDVYLTGPLDLIFAEDDVAIQTGSYIQTVGWSGEFLQVGPVNLGRGCKIGMRSTISNNVTIGAGAWITPLTPILSDVGSHEVWEGAPAVASGSCIELERTRRVTSYDHPVWLLETLGASMQILFTLLLTVIPVAVILWFGGQVVFPDSIGLTDPDLDVRTVILHLLWPLALYALSTTWVSIFVTSLLDCLFIRFTAGEPGIYPSRGLRAAMLMYRIAILNSLQRMWTWTLTGQYLRAIAGVRFRRVGASECDVMFNLVPEAATADSQVFWSSGSYTNMLDLGAKHFTLRRMDMPHNFFTGNNGVVESGQFPSNFLLGVSTPAGDNAYRRQMRSRPGEPITIAGNPPVRFAASSEEHQSETLPGFPLFLARVFMNDLFSVGTLPVIEGLFLTVVWVAFWRLGVDPVVSAIVGFLMAQIFLIFLCVGVKKLLVGRTWGANHRTPFWSLRHFAYFFAQDAFFAWCRVPLTAFSGTVVANWLLRLMGCEIGKRTIVAQPLQCFDWNAVSFGSDCYIDGYLQLHTFEDMVLKVKRTHVGDGCTVNVGSTVMGGASIESGTTLLSLSLVLKEMDVQAGVYEGSPIQELSAPTALALANRAPAVPAPEVLEEPVSRIVDNTDWLKFAAIILVLIDHFGYFLMASDRWWGVFGRFAAPSFFFLLGYANTRSIPIPWLLLGGILTLLESSNNDWTWVGPNILFSFAIIRFGRPYARKLIEGYGGIAYIILMIGLVAVLPLAAPVVDYGAEGWLWALLGLSQRLWIDGKEQAEIMTDPAPPSRWTANLARILVCGVAAVVYVWQEQKEFVFTHKQWTVLVVGVVVLAICFLSFSRGPSRLKPPPTVARAIRWIGRRTLEIYVIELVVFELIVKVFPSLAP